MKYFAVLFLLVCVAELVFCQFRCDPPCEENECCVIDLTRRMKCKRMGEEGNRCSARYNPLNIYFGHCPCREGLDCRPDQVWLKCQAKSTESPTSSSSTTATQAS